MLTGDGMVLTFGAGESGKLGHGREDKEFLPRLVDALVGRRVVQVAAGYSHTAVLTSDGEVFVFGSNDFGQLGVEGEDKELRDWVRTERSVGEIGLELWSHACDAQRHQGKHQEGARSAVRSWRS